MGIGAGAFTFFTGAKSAEEGLTSFEPVNLSLGDSKIDIQTYSFNEEKFIEDTLKSLKNQPLYRKSDDVSLTVVDSKSTDRTVQVAEKYADRIWTAERGKLTARDYGTRKTEADIIVSTDADTLYLEGWLSNILTPLF